MIKDIISNMTSADLFKILEKGVSLVILAVAVYLLWENHLKSNEYIYKENLSLKDENKELRYSNQAELIKFQNEILNNQKEILLHLKNRQ